MRSLILFVSLLLVQSAAFASELVPLSRRSWSLLKLRSSVITAIPIVNEV